MQQQSTAISLHTPLSEIDYAFYMKVLHVGSGPKLDKLHPYFREHSWVETRLDIDPECQPDIVASITDMTAVASQSMDAVYSSHNLEHLHAHEVTLAVREFLRVLKPRGFALIALPDLQSVAQLVVERGLNATAYVSSAGPVAPIDMIYGHRAAIACGMHFMAHRTADPWNRSRSAAAVAQPNCKRLRLQAPGRRDRSQPRRPPASLRWCSPAQ
jgi:SAM-dependent methyltransferase